MVTNGDIKCLLGKYSPIRKEKKRNKKLLAVPANIEQTGISMLMNKSQSDSAWENKIEAVFHKETCCFTDALFSQ